MSSFVGKLLSGMLRDSRAARHRRGGIVDQSHPLNANHSHRPPRRNPGPPLGAHGPDITDFRLPQPPYLHLVSSRRRRIERANASHVRALNMAFASQTAEGYAVWSHAARVRARVAENLKARGGVAEPLHRDTGLTRDASLEQRREAAVHAVVNTRRSLPMRGMLVQTFLRVEEFLGLKIATMEFDRAFNTSQGFNGGRL